MTSKHEPGIPVTFEGEVVGRAIMHGDGTQAAIFVTGDIADRLRGGDVGGFSIAEDVAGAPSPSSGPRCFGLSGCKYDEPHEHGFACDRACTVCNGWTPGTEVRPGVVRIEGNGQRVDVEVDAVLCSTDSHAGTVPAVVFGEFRVPWWSAERTEPAAYCSACARMLGFMGYFTPDNGAQA
ncbi:hypothetical protein SEA_BASILISK_60 [Arthrobacter phage Basilisk]|nr:hypothetical protein SEA_BASILISK_60 [Arthrobacter phage Basilisk]